MEPLPTLEAVRNSDQSLLRDVDNLSHNLRLFKNVNGLLVIREWLITAQKTFNNAAAAVDKRISELIKEEAETDEDKPHWSEFPTRI